MLSKGAANQAYPQQCDAPVTCWGRELRAKEHCHLERERERDCREFPTAWGNMRHVVVSVQYWAGTFRVRAWWFLPCDISPPGLFSVVLLCTYCKWNLIWCQLSVCLASQCEERTFYYDLSYWVVFCRLHLLLHLGDLCRLFWQSCLGDLSRYDQVYYSNFIPGISWSSVTRLCKGTLEEEILLKQDKMQALDNLFWLLRELSCEGNVHKSNLPVAQYMYFLSGGQGTKPGLLTCLVH